jgi:hypothetical protein
VFAVVRWSDFWGVEGVLGVEKAKSVRYGQNLICLICGDLL